MAEPLGYLVTWTTYGTWLPGDERGWVEEGVEGIREPVRVTALAARNRMTETVVLLDEQQRRIVEDTIRTHCGIRAWTLHAVNVRTNHVHVVVTAGTTPEKVLSQFKSWCFRPLKEQGGQREHWWTHLGSTKWINDEDYLANAIRYVMDR